MTYKFTEDVVEEATLGWLEELGYSISHGPNIAFDGDFPERPSYQEVVLPDRLKAAVMKLNPDISRDAQSEAIRQVLTPSSPSLIINNRAFHKMLTDGVEVEFQREDGTTGGAPVKLIDFDNPESNEFLSINQFTIIEGDRNRRPDVVIVVNGLPLAVIELKNAVDTNATVWSAYNQLQTYKHDIPSLFTYNQMLVISDGLDARMGTLTSDKERFMAWRTVDGEDLAPTNVPQLDTLLKGVFQKERFLDLISNFIVFEDTDEVIIKKIAAYHQYHAVNKAVASTVEASSVEGDKRAGVIWHTQGSGKSLSMVFYAGKVIRHPAMANPTIVAITDRNDLDDQLFNTFSACRELLRQAPQQAEDRDHLDTLLQVASGGVVFATIQKFMPKEGNEKPILTDRRNVVVIADEAHRTQYGFEAKVDTKTGKLTYGLAKYLRDALPNASYIGFTGTPVELGDKNTKEVFGNYIDIYDIQQAVEDKATVKILYENRLAKLSLSQDEKPNIDPNFDEVTEGEEEKNKERLKTKWASLEAMVGNPRRISLIAQDIVNHFENRQVATQGKGMIVGMSRRICAELYQAITDLRPDWHNDEDDQGKIKVVMTGSASDPEYFQPHIRSKRKREELAKRFRKPDNEFELVIVRDMWLTGFDAPSLHTMYIDKPMKGHNLMQAIARVNRVFRDKQGGLVVDYIGVANFLQDALREYTERDRDSTGVPINEALALMQEKFEVVEGIYHGFNYQKFFDGNPMERLSILPAAMEHVLNLEDGKRRYLQAVTELSKAYSLVSAMDEAIEIREKVAFFQAVRASIVKNMVTEGAQRKEDIDGAIQQIVSNAVSSSEVVDVFASMGRDKPDISILSAQFIAEVRDIPYKNVAAEVLRRLIEDEIRTRSKTNIIQSRSFAEMLDKSVKKLQNRSIETAQVIEELINLAEEMRNAKKRGDDLGLADDELAFYDALEVSDSAVKVLGDEILKAIAQELTRQVRQNTTIDWSVKESVRANLRRLVKRILRKYGYPPEKQESATTMVLQQAEHLATAWTTS